MKRKHPDIAIVRRVGRRKSRVRIGPRVFLFFVVALLLVAGAAISINLKLEDTLQKGAQQPR